MNKRPELLSLAIESSCDETSAAILKGGRTVLSNVISTQIDIHQKYGGVVPEIASRNHLLNISQVVDEALLQAGAALTDLDFISVTNGPGLVGALLVGLSYAKGLAFALNKDIVGVNHMQGHICANFLLGAEPPFICLTASGGHTNITKVTGHTSFDILGSTRDDAAGEAFDKVARTLGLGYPGGAEIDKAAEQGNENAIEFPRAYLEQDSFDFSFSGIKSAVLNYLNSMKMKNLPIPTSDVAASFRKSVVEVMIDKSLRAVRENNLNTLCIGGGVACNSLLRQRLAERCQAENVSLFLPPPVYCTDNAAMIGCAGYYNYLSNKRDSIALNAVPALKLESF